MRSSYFLYALKKLREGRFLVLAKQAYKFVTLPLAYYLNKPLSGPIHGVFVVNYDCNLKCGMCSLMNRPSEYRKKGIKPLTTDEIKSVIDDFARINTSGIGFTGGEPIMRKDLPELISYAKSKGILTHLSTNGLLMNEENVKKVLDAGLDAIGFSLDAAKRETHDSIRGLKGSYDKVIKGIKNFKNLREEYKKDVVIIVVCVINRRNLDEVVDLVNVALEAGADQVSFSPVHDISLMVKGKKSLEGFNLTKEEISKLDKVIDKLIEIKEKTGKIDNSAEYLRLFKPCLAGEKSPLDCYAGFLTIGVDGYGNIFPCFSWMEMEKYVGNVRKKSLREYWKSKEFKDLRKEIRGCHDCYWNNQTELNLLFSKKNRNLVRRL